MGDQEKWLWQNKDNCHGLVFVGVGGSLDFLTGFSQRAPLVCQRAGLEWLWRAFQRPAHFRRVWQAVFVFVPRVLREKFG